MPNQQQEQQVDELKSMHQPSDRSSVVSDVNSVNSASSQSMVSQQSLKAAGAQAQTPIHFQQRISLYDWHPFDNTFTVSNLNELFIYTQRKAK